MSRPVHVLAVIRSSGHDWQLCCFTWPIVCSQIALDTPCVTSTRLRKGSRRASVEATKCAPLPPRKSSRDSDANKSLIQPIGAHGVDTSCVHYSRYRAVRIANIYWGKGKGKRGIADSNYRLTATDTGTHMGSHSVACHPADVTIRSGSQHNPHGAFFSYVWCIDLHVCCIRWRCGLIGTVNAALLLFMLEDTRSAWVHKLRPIKTSIHLDDDPIFAYCDENVSGIFAVGVFAGFSKVSSHQYSLTRLGMRSVVSYCPSMLISNQLDLYLDSLRVHHVP